MLHPLRLLVLAVLARLTGADLARWWPFGDGLPPPPPPPRSFFALLSTAASPACASTCALVLSVEGTGRTLASLSPLRPSAIAVVEGAEAGTRARAAVRCPPRSGCSPLGAGLALGALGEGGGASPVVLDGLVTLHVHEERRNAKEEGEGAGGSGARAGDGAESYEQASHRPLPTSSSRRASAPSAESLSPLALTSLAVLALANGLAVGAALAAVRSAT